MALDDPRIPGFGILETAIQKVLDSTKRDAEFTDLTKSVGSNKLEVNVYPQLELVDFYEGYRAPECDYCPQSVNSRVQVERQSECRRSVSLDEALALAKGGYITFVGPAGSGKTTMLKSIARDVAAGKQVTLDGIQSIHFLQGRNLHLEDEVTAKELFLHNAGLSHEETDAYLKFVQENPSRILFIVDSLDTFPYDLGEKGKQIGTEEASDPGTILWNLLTGNIYPGCKVITSSREHTIRAYTGNLRARSIVALVGLTIDSITKIVQGYFPDADEAGNIMDRLIKSPTLLSLCSTPVFLSFTLVGFRVQFQLDPNTMTGILVLVLQSLVRSDLARTENIEEVIHKLKSLAYNGLMEKRVLFSTRELASYLLTEDEVTDLTIIAPGLRHQKLLKKESSLFFNHQSLQELLAAYYIAELDSQRFGTFIEQYIHSPYFAVVRRILCGLMLNDEIKSAAHRFFEVPPDPQHRMILIESLKKQLQQCDVEDSLELLISLHEAGNAIDALVATHLSSIDLRRVTFSAGDMDAVGSIISRCKHLDTLDLPYCNLNANLLGVLNSSIKLKVEIDSVDIRGNNGMTSTGLRSVAEIVQKCQCTTLQMSACDLQSDEVIEFNSALQSPKIEILILGFNNEMGQEGFSAIGEIVERCKVEILSLCRCEMKKEELIAMKTSMKDEKVKKLNLSESDTYGQNKSSIPVNELCKFLPWVTEELDLKGCQLKDEEIEALQQALDEEDLKGLQILIGPPNNWEILEAGKPRTLRKETPSKVEGRSEIINVNEYGIANTEGRISCETGGSLKLHGSGIEILPRSLENDALISVVLSNEGTDIPDEYQVISPTLTCETECVKLKKGQEFLVAIEPWCYAETTFKIIVFRKKDETWGEYQILSLGEEKKARFRTSEISKWLLAIKPTIEAKRILKYPIHTCLYFNGLQAAYAYCCIDDKLALSRIQKHAEQMYFNYVIPWQEPYIVKMDDTVQVVLLSDGQQNGSGFEFSGVFKSNGFLRMEFNVQLTHESFSEGGLLYHLFVCKNRRVVRAIPFSITHKQPESLEFPGDVSEREGQSRGKSEENDETGGDIGSGVVSFSDEIAKSREIEEIMRTCVKRRFYISKKGRTVEFQGCTMIFPPEAFDKVTAIDITVSLRGEDIPADYVPLTPILGCSVNGAVLKRPVKVKLPTCSVFKERTRCAVLVKKSRETSWRNIGDTEVDCANPKVEFEVTHFCKYFAGLFKRVGRSILSLFGTGEVQFFSRLYYKRSNATFLVLSLAFSDDCASYINDQNYKEVMPTPCATIAESGDKITFKLLDCRVKPHPEECSFQVDEEFIKKKYEPLIFRLPTKPVADKLFHFTYAIYINGKQHRDFALALGIDDLKDPEAQAEQNGTMEDATKLVGNISIQSASKSFYEKQNRSDRVYNFSEDKRKGKALIINNHFTGTDNARMGSDHDFENMESLWEKFGLDVVLEADLDQRQMIEKIRRFGDEARDVGMCVLVIMSHGGLEGGDDAIACENGGIVNLEDILNELSNSRCPHLRGIPKLVLLECCRGENTLPVPDTPEALGEETTNQNTVSVCDTVIAYATQRNYVAYLNIWEGSWFINAITNIFMRDAHDTHVVDMLVHTNDAVSRRRTEGSQQQCTQLMDIRSSLRKKFYLFPGWPEPTE